MHEQHERIAKYCAMKRSLTWLALAIVATGATACSSSTNGGTPAPPPACLAEVGATGALVFPAQNASNVPDNLAQVIIATTTTLPAGWDIELFTTGGFLVAVSAGNLGPAPNPLPTPNTIPPFPNPIYQSGTGFGTLPAATTLQVGINNSGSGCVPTIVGVFTTQ